MKIYKTILFLIFIVCMIAVSCSKDTGHDSTTIYRFDEDGASTALFSVSDTRQIHFSCGNLQYQESDNTWHFAEHQFDFIGDENVNGSKIDLFEWTTSDWGINPIINGGNQANLWRTLTLSEWKYLLGNSTLRKGKKGIANVCGIHGLIILPDNWVSPKNISFISNPSDWNKNTYNSSEWESMESSGAIFLPSAGCYEENDIANVGVAGFYWPSPTNSENGSSVCVFDENGVWILENELNYCGEGYSVRLVKD